MEQQFQRWTAKRKAELILDLIKGTKSLVDVCREQAPLRWRQVGRTCLCALFD